MSTNDSNKEKEERNKRINVKVNSVAEGHDPVCRRNTTCYAMVVVSMLHFLRFQEVLAACSLVFTSSLCGENFFSGKVIDSRPSSWSQVDEVAFLHIPTACRSKHLSGTFCSSFSDFSQFLT